MSRADRHIALSHLVVNIIMLVVGGGLARTWEPLRTLLRVDEGTTLQVDEGATQAAYRRTLASLRATRQELDAVEGQLLDHRMALEQSQLREEVLQADLRQANIDLWQANIDLRQAERDVDALASLGECIHDNDARRPPRRLDSVAGCTVEAKLQWDREIRFYGQRSPIRIGDPIVLAVVPDRLDTGSFHYQWDVSQCWSGRTNGARTGPIFAFTMIQAGSSCRIDLYDAQDVYRLSYYVAR